jgi:hypothetical protein
VSTAPSKWTTYTRDDMAKQRLDFIGADGAFISRLRMGSILRTPIGIGPYLGERGDSSRVLVNPRDKAHHKRPPR